MTEPIVDTDLVTRICGDATDRSGNGIAVHVARDPLDDIVWVRMPSRLDARQALTVLNTYGIGGRELDDGRLHVTGWDVRLLHRRLGTLLAGVDDLTTEWDATAELVCYHHDRRVAAGVEPDPAEVLDDVEIVMRSCVPIPHRAPKITDIDSLLQFIAAAEDAYQQLIAEHVDHAERVLAEHASREQDRAEA